jgi:hypothetical protein
MASEDECRPLSWAGQKRRSGLQELSQAREARAAIAAQKTRKGGQFVKEAKTTLPVRSQAERAEKEIDSLKRKFDKQVAESRAVIANLQAQYQSTVTNLHKTMAVKDKELLQLRTTGQIRFRGATPTKRVQKERRLYGGTTAPTKVKLAKRLETLLAAKFATEDARKQALYEHFVRHPTDYHAILNHNPTRASFEQLCKDHKEWLIPIQQDLVHRIGAAWTLQKCLSIQIHCKVGGAKKYQHAINILAKNYSEEARKWIPHEIYEASRVFFPLLKSKNQVIGFREAIIAENPLIQDENGTAVWLDLDKLVEEAIRDDRTHGYLQARTQLDSDTVWLHWGSDAAG